MADSPDIRTLKPEQGENAPNGRSTPAENTDSQKPGPANQEASPNEVTKPKRPASAAKGIIIATVVGAAVIFGVTWGVGYYHYSTTHVSTDDAYMAGDLVNVSPIVSGTISHLYVSEGDMVKKGQLVARLDDSGPSDSVRQAQAAYDAANSMIPEAKLQLALQQQETSAAIQKAQAALGNQRAKTSGAVAQLSLVRSTNQGQIAQSKGMIAAARAQAEEAQAQVGAAAGALSAARQAVITAEHASGAIQANIAAARADQVKTGNDVSRYSTLVKVEAVTRQQYDAVVAADASARSQLASAQQQYAQSRSQVAQARATLQQVGAQLSAAREAASAALQQVTVARAGLAISQANSGQIGVQQSNLQGSRQTDQEASADLQNAMALKGQTALRRRQIDTARAQAEQQLAQLDNAKVLEQDTYICAPAGGEVVRKTASVGDAMSPGQTVFTMTQNGQSWVEANYKETQVVDVKPGQNAEVDVDAVPGKTFHGVVRSISQATGASTALLPPDNATGNFTKVVQRLQVRIDLVPAKDGEENKWATLSDIRNLRQGESVTATIDTSSH